MNSVVQKLNKQKLALPLLELAREGNNFAISWLLSDNLSSIDYIKKEMLNDQYPIDSLLISIYNLEQSSHFPLELFNQKENIDIRIFAKMFSFIAKYYNNYQGPLIKKLIEESILDPTIVTEFFGAVEKGSISAMHFLISYFLGHEGVNDIDARIYYTKNIFIHGLFHPTLSSLRMYIYGELNYAEDLEKFIAEIDKKSLEPSQAHISLSMEDAVLKHLEYMADLQNSVNNLLKDDEDNNPLLDIPYVESDSPKL